MTLPTLDRFAWVALFFCAFSLCTTRPIDTDRRTASNEVAQSDAPDKIDALNAKIEAVEAKSGSLSVAIRGIVYAPKNRRVSVRSEREIWIGPYRDSTGGKPFNFEINSHQNNNNNE